MNFKERIQVVPKANLFTEEGYYVWCGTMFKFNGAYYMVYSRWERSCGFQGWVTDCKVCLAKSDTLEGQFHHVKVLFDYEGNCPGERKVMHNPSALVHNGRVYLYFMMTYGMGDVWENRNRQRIGVAWTDDPEGEWTKMPNPVIDITPGGIDSLMVSNPTATVMPDGKILMVYKAVGDKDELPKGGPVILGAAIGDTPLGPFRKSGKPQFVNPESSWSVEDPFIWYEDGWFYALVKDYTGYFTKVKTHWSGSTALFRSANGLDWEPDPEHPLAYTNELMFDDGPAKLRSLERPQLYIEDGKTKALLCACVFFEDESTGYTDSAITYNVKIPLDY